MMPPTWVVFQLSLEAIFVLVESKMSKVGLRTASAIPKGTREGPIARIRIFLVDPAGPSTMSPSINALSPMPTGSRVETLATSPAVAVGVAVGVAVPPGVAVGVAVAVAVGVAVGVAVAVAVGVGLG